MAVQNLQSLVLRAAPFAGVRATGRESKALDTVMVGNPVQAPSSPWYPLPGLDPIRTGYASAVGHRGYSMQPGGGRAGRAASPRSARAAGVTGRIGFARIGCGTILSSWSRTTGTADTTRFVCAGAPKCLGHLPAPAGNRSTGLARRFGGRLHEAPSHETRWGEVRPRAMADAIA